MILSPPVMQLSLHATRQRASREPASLVWWILEVALDSLIVPRYVVNEPRNVNNNVRHDLSREQLISPIALYPLDPRFAHVIRGLRVAQINAIINRPGL